MAVTMNGDYLMLNALIPAATGVPSNPIRMGEGNNALSVQGLVIAGALLTGTSALVVQHSNDGLNWTTVASLSAFSGATALDLKEGNATGVTQRFARVVVTGASGSAAIVNISAQPYRA